MKESNIAILTILGCLFLFMFIADSSRHQPLSDKQEKVIEAARRDGLGKKTIKRSFKNGNSYEIEVDEDLTRDNWDCTGNCSGHEAGYEWAEENGIDDPDDCGGNSASFAEGCEAYANEY